MGKQTAAWVGPLLALATALAVGGSLFSQERTTLALATAVPDMACDKLLPINLGSALQLAGVRPLDIDMAVQRVQLAGADLERAKVLWLPTLYLGVDYYRHDGNYQDSAGNILSGSKSSFMLGAGPSAIFALSDAIFAPLAARQVIRARQASLEAAKNDSMLAVAEAYFNVQQAVGDLAAAEDVKTRTVDLVRRTETLTQIASPVEIVRARTERDRRSHLVELARERRIVAAADLRGCCGSNRE